MKQSTVVFKNGDTLKQKGFVQSKTFKYKVNEKWVEIPFDEIDYVDVINETGNLETYRQLKIKGQNTYVVAKNLARGKISLYVHSRQIETNGHFFTGAGAVKHRVYKEYLKREGEQDVIGIQEHNYFRKNFRTAAKIYFKDCPELVQKIENKELKKRQLKEMVDYYNTNCTKSNN